MKKSLLIILFIFSGIHINAQTDGISYQAVIINPNGTELPGVDTNGDILPNAKIAIRFTILDATNSEEYQEVQMTQTDMYGRINLIIGKEKPENFALIEWDGTPKDLKVEIDFKGSGSNFVDMSREELTFVPYSYHRNIWAHGTLTVDDASLLNGELTVQLPTHLNSSLDVNGGNETNLSGDLKVAGMTKLNDSLTVANQSPTHLSGTLDLEGNGDFKGDLNVDGELKVTDLAAENLTVENIAEFNGQVTIKPIIENKDIAALLPINDQDANQSDYDQYPLRVEGSYQGIAIKIEEGRDRTNNFISFWDEEKMWGRIEGLTSKDQLTNYQWLREWKSKQINVATNTFDLGIYVVESFQVTFVELPARATGSTVCAGAGACVTAPIPTMIVSGSLDAVLSILNAISVSVQLVIAIEDKINFEVKSLAQVGVSYSSGAGDYAEWLPKLIEGDEFKPGELVGIKNGFVTKNVWGADKIMAVSTNPIVLGNMPQPKQEKNYVKIAFMGQVPVKVLGKVSPGDYILPSEIGVGFAKAVNPNNMNLVDYKKIVGISWNVIDKISEDISIVNIAVGINTNDLSDAVIKQEEEINRLKERLKNLDEGIQKSNTVLAGLFPEFAEAMEIAGVETLTSNAINKVDNLNASHENIEQNVVHSNEDDILYFELPREQIEMAFTMYKELYQKASSDQNALNKLIFGKSNLSNMKVSEVLPPLEEHPFWKKIDNDPAYKEEIINVILSTMKDGMHTHQKYAKEYTDLKVYKD